MKRSRFFFIMTLMVICAGISACGTESDGVTTGTALSTFSEDVRLCTPVLDGSGQDLGDNTLDEWPAWDPQGLNSVLGKLFNTNIGGQECIHTQIELLDAHIAKVNDFVEYWEEDGTYTMGDMTAVIDNGTSSVYVPYLRGFFSDLSLISVEREITLTDSGDDLTIHMAFLTNGDEEYIVSQYVMGSSRSGVYYTERSGASLRIWHASIDSRKVQFTWEGNVEEQWFRITQCSDASGNWEVMGGGSAAADDGEMAFMARNDDTNSSNDEYYITITLQELTDGTEPSGGIIDAGDTVPDGSGVLAYITDGEPECFGFLGPDAYPGSVGDLAWSQ